MFYSIDRFEGEFAVLVGDDEKQYDVPRKELPAGASESDILCKVGEAYSVDDAETARRKAKIQDLLNKLPKRG